MKSMLIVLSACLAVALAAEDPHGLKAAHEKCHGSSADHSTDPPKSPESLLCLAKEIGFVDAEGKINKDGVKIHVGHVITDVDQAAEIVKECAVERDSTDETVKTLWKCLHKKQVLGHHHHSSEENGSSESSEHHHHHH